MGWGQISHTEVEGMENVNVLDRFKAFQYLHMELQAREVSVCLFIALT